MGVDFLSSGDQAIVPGRAVAARVSALGMGKVLVFSIYMVTGVGWPTENKLIMDKVGEVIEREAQIAQLVFVFVPQLSHCRLDTRVDLL